MLEWLGPLVIRGSKRGERGGGEQSLSDRGDVKYTGEDIRKQPSGKEFVLGNLALEAALYNLVVA